LDASGKLEEENRSESEGKILYAKYQGFIVASTADQRLFVLSLLPKEMRPWTAGALRELF
jgi:hypothetical protein